MLALAAAWLGLVACGLSLLMVFYRPAFNDRMVPAVLYGAVLALTCGGLVLMRKTQPGDRGESVTAQRIQSQVGICLALAAVMITYALFALADRSVAF